ncbi:MAG: hypothetical protein KUF82_20685, partial [Candidatus Thiodiazotropha sp. (ex Ctena orbiculata)]|nr:hypothetical protein [Candidatus Thiodiazotropha taylori]
LSPVGSPAAQQEDTFQVRQSISSLYSELPHFKIRQGNDSCSPHHLGMFEMQYGDKGITYRRETEFFIRLYL